MHFLRFAPYDFDLVQEESMRGSRSAVLVAFVAAVLSSFSAAPALGDEVMKRDPRAVSKSGIPYRPDNEQAGPPELVNAIRARRGGKLLNLDRMLLHSPNFAKGWNAMFAAIRGQLSLKPKLRELAIMSIAVLNKADYEWAQHEGEFLTAGGTREQLAALKDSQAAEKNTKLFSDAERATLALTREMTRDIVVSAVTMKRIRALLPDQEVVELIGTISGYNMVSRFLVATGLELEQ
jgi:alkylhydroperoxidase family enzyme